METKFQLVFLLCVNLFAFCSAEGDFHIDYPTLSPNWSYCYEFTWFGPDYNNATGYNGTCEDFMDDTRAGENIPCIPPIVIANDGTEPNISYLWENHRASVLCMRSESQACVKYSYLYNGIIANQSHMCARVRSDKKEISTGCYTQQANGYTIEMCVCKSGFGLTQPPCNDTVMFKAVEAIVMVGLVFQWLGKY